MRSMTGFGRGGASAGDWRVDVELSGVNRKQVDIAVSLPPSVAEWETDLRCTVAAAVSRGRIGVKVVLSHTARASGELVFDEGLARQYVDAVRQFSEKEGIEPRLTAADLFRAPGVFLAVESNADPEGLKETAQLALREALEQLVAMQKKEGVHLRDDLFSRLESIVAAIEVIRELAPSVPESYRQQLHKRLRESGLELDWSDERFLREIGIFAERCDISEELTRLDSHVEQFRRYLASEEAVGRPLDFLCQELHREINTIGSKANHAEIAQQVVNAKTELEKIREQVQNVQ